MRLEKAHKKAIQYACINFHYAKLVAPRCYDNSYSVFNDKDEWCGVICFGRGGTPQIASPFGLNQGQVIELIRVALNGKQEQTSKVISTAIRLVKKENPLVKLIVSYADKGQNHLGIIYQASNWFYIGGSESSGLEYKVFGKWTHPSSIKYMNLDKSRLERRKMSGKHKYIYPLDKSLISLCKSLSKPYPKRAALPHRGEDDAIQHQGAFDSTVPLNTVINQ